jgi:hypothetical protein
MDTLESDRAATDRAAKALGSEDVIHMNILNKELFVLIQHAIKTRVDFSRHCRDARA